MKGGGKGKGETVNYSKTTYIDVESIVFTIVSIDSDTPNEV